MKQFYFFDPGPIPPPVIMIQHVSFRYSDNTVSFFFLICFCAFLLSLIVYAEDHFFSLTFTKILILAST